MKIKSSKEVAGALGITVKRVQQLAEEMGLPRFGRQFVITEKDEKHMAARKTQRGPAKKSK